VELRNLGEPVRSAEGSTPVGVRTVGIVYRKELLETLRDRRTLIVMVLLPLCLYPIVGIGITRLIGAQEVRREQRPSRVALQGPVWTDLERGLGRGHKIEVQRRQATEDALRRARIDLLLVVPDDHGRTLERNGTVKLKLLYDATSDRSRLALQRTREVVRDLTRRLVRARLQHNALPPTLTRPIDAVSHQIATGRAVDAQLMARVLPMLVILMVLLGAFYPAIDVTAGEKERGTLETLLATPVNRISLMAGKYLVVATAAVITGLLNLLSIGLTLKLGLAPALKAAHVASSIPWDAVALTVVAMIPAALFFAAAMIAVASLGRSFKEAQNLLTPVLLVCQLPALAAQIPGVELNLVTALVPVVNIALLTRDLIAGRVLWIPAGVTLLSLLAYTAVALKLAARVFESERLLFAPDPGTGRGRGLWRRLLRRDRGAAAGPGASHAAASPSQAAALLLAVMALILLVGQPLQAHQLMTGLLITEWVLILVPVLLLLRLANLSPRGALALSRPSPTAVVGGVLAGLSAWYLVGLLVELIQQRVMPMPPEMAREYHRALFASDRNLLLDLFALAISPAICEELLFRGVLLQATRSVMSVRSAVLLNGFLFGVFHISPYRFLSTMLLGMVLALIVLRAGSIVPGMLFHMLNNASAIVAGKLLGEEEAASSEAALSWPLLSAATVLFVVGMTLAIRAGPSAPRDPAG